ncbi:zf-C3HC-domain-containing protein [Xylariaceae sp. FL0662B]|nr:zf-C3HC-domain-containing protein [Xylariaceae sp. FL0662B]
MNTTKRKFNSLLQGIGARSTPQLSERSTQDEHLVYSSPLNRPVTPDSTSVPDAATPKTMPGMSSPLMNSDFFKRRRVGVLESTTANEKTGATTISNVVLKKWTPGSKTTAAGKDSKDDAPKYGPGDRDELIRRLGTFQELTEWTPKPDRVNEIEWAKRGWVCQGKERVRCTLCNKELVVNTSKREVEGKEVPILVGSDFEEALVKKFVEMIIDAHQEDCLWRKRGCDDTLLRLSLTHPPTALASLRQRYDDLCTRPAFLPYLFNLRLPPNLDLQAVKKQLPPTFFSDPPPPSTNPATPNEVALALALIGWQGLTNPRIGAVPNSASCATCLRRLGLWMFKSKEVDEATGQVVVPAPMDHLDPVREHRFFCPWRSPAAQHNPGSKTADGKTAWEVLAQTIKNDASLRAHAQKITSTTASSKRFSAHAHRPAASAPTTPSRVGAAAAAGPDRYAELPVLGPGMAADHGDWDEDEDAGARDAKDKERWARLRRVKTLFNTKGGQKLRRTLSRPGTASSRPPTGHERQGSVPPRESMSSQAGKNATG